MSVSSSSSKMAVRRLAWMGGVVVAGAVSFGYISFEVGPMVAFLVFTAVIGLAYALGSNDDELSISFALSLVAVALLIAEFLLPGAVTSRLPYYGAISSTLDPLTFALLAGLTILGWWVIDIRLIQRSGVKPDTVAKRVRARAEKLVEAYVTMGRIGVGLIAAGVVVVLSELGVLAGEIWSYVAEAPFIGVNFLLSFIGYVALGGPVLVESVPVVGDLTAGGFALIALSLMAVAAGVKYAD